MGEPATRCMHATWSVPTSSLGCYSHCPQINSHRLCRCSLVMAPPLFAYRCTVLVNSLLDVATVTVPECTYSHPAAATAHAYVAQASRAQCIPDHQDNRPSSNKHSHHRQWHSFIPTNSPSKILPGCHPAPPSSDPCFGPSVTAVEIWRDTHGSNWPAQKIALPENLPCSWLFTPDDLLQARTRRLVWVVFLASGFHSRRRNATVPSVVTRLKKTGQTKNCQANPCR